MKTTDKLLEGRTKILYKSDQEGQLLMEFLDTLPLDTPRKTSLKGKGTINAEITSYIFEYLHSYNIPTHFIKKTSDKVLQIKKLQMIPLQMLIWNMSTTGLSKRFGIHEGTALETPIIEFYLKDAKLKNPMVNDYHAYALGLCDRNDMGAIIRIGTKTNAVLRSYFQRKNFSLVNFTLEFGKAGNQVMIGDEISPDTFSIWGISPEGKLDKKNFVISSANAKQVYHKLHELFLK